MKRSELISEIMQSFNDMLSLIEVQTGVSERDRLREALLRVSEASFEAGEVEEKDDPWAHGYNIDMTNGWNESRTAQQEKRKSWCEDK